MQDTATVVGMIAGLCTTAAFVPQVVRIIKTRHTADLSLAMYAIFVAGTLLWLAYGLMIGSLPVVIYNLLTSLLAGAVLVMKLRFG